MRTKTGLMAALIVFVPAAALALWLVLGGASGGKPAAKPPAGDPGLPVPKVSRAEQEQVAEYYQYARQYTPRSPFAWLAWAFAIFAALLAFHVLLLCFLAADVRARAPEQAPLWFFVFIAGGLLGVLFWLLARPPRRQTF